MERVEYNEFGYFHENAAEYGLAFDGPPVVRREFVEVEPGRRLSALVWKTGEPEIVLIHGGAQNAHTWDTVAMALDRPLIAIDLPGHGHSDSAGARSEGQLNAEGNAADVAAVIRALAPNAKVVVGMSLGGLTATALSGMHPELVRRLVLVDITPGVKPEKTAAITAFVHGPETFPSFEQLLARTIEHNPTRTVSSLRRGILHNALQKDDGSWVWRYRRFGDALPIGADRPADWADQPAGPPDYARLWELFERFRGPVMLVRGMLPQSVLDDDNENDLFRRRPDARLTRIANAGHSVQGDTPRELAVLIDEFADS